MPEETLTTDDLKRVFIRAQTKDGKWASIHCAEATDLQFDTWAHSRIEIQGGHDAWSMRERADFCNMLYQSGMLHILKKDIEE